MIQDYVSIDLETTGLNPKKDAIIEIGAIKVKDGRVCDSFQTLINPHVSLSSYVTELTGIRNEDIGNQPSFEEIMPSLQQFLGEEILLGHSVAFDYSFLKRAIVNASGVTNKGKDTFERDGIDTLKIARVLHPELESRSLSALCKYYDIPLKPHRALEDAAATAKLYEKMKEAAQKPDLFLTYPLIYKVKKEGPITPAQKERLYLLVERHKIVPAFEIDALTKNEASRYLDKILAEYGR